MARNRTAQKLLLGLLGGNAVMPESLSDDFAADSGLWLDGNLTAAAITTSGGRGIWTPTLGTEKLTAPDFDSWAGGIPAGWAIANAGDSAVTETAPDGLAGTGAATLTSTTSVSRPLVFGANLNTNKWNQIELVVSTFTSGTLNVGHSGAEFARITGVGTHYVVGYAPNPNLYIYNAALPLNLVLDRVSSKTITAETMFRVRRIYYPSSVAAKVRYLRAAPIGVAVYKDSNNWVAALIQSVPTSASTNRINLYKMVGGVLSSVTTAAITYSADSVLQLTPAADFQQWSVAYGGSTVINAASIIDFTASGVWYAGLVTTRDASDTSIIGFDDFAANRVGGAIPF